MYIEAKPIGVTPLSDEDRMPLWKVTSGDEWKLTTQLQLPDGTPCTPQNSRVTFAISETRFSSCPYWRGAWLAGIMPLNRAGLVEIKIPQDISNELRRGVYSFSVLVQDVFLRKGQTQLTGSIQVEYEPTSPNHNIPYRHSQWGELDRNPNQELSSPCPVYTVEACPIKMPYPIGEPNA